MKDFQFSNYRFSEGDVKKALTSPEGKKLLQILGQDGGTRLRQAADALRSGNTDEFQKVLSPVMETEEAAALLKKLDQG